MTDEQIQKVRDLTLWDLRPYREFLQRDDLDGFLAAYLQQPAVWSELPPDAADHVRLIVRQYLSRLGQR